MVTRTQAAIRDASIMAQKNMSCFSCAELPLMPMTPSTAREVACILTCVKLDTKAGRVIEYAVA